MHLVGIVNVVVLKLQTAKLSVIVYPDARRSADVSSISPILFAVVQKENASVARDSSSIRVRPIWRKFGFPSVNIHEDYFFSDTDAK